MTHANEAIEILRATRDGNDLDPRHLYLVQLAVNDHLSEKGEAAFAELVANVKRGYVKPWFHGIEHLTQTQAGYVRWRGISVEHYSYSDFEAEKQAAVRLGEACRRIEARGGIVSIGSVLDELEKVRAA